MQININSITETIAPQLRTVNYYHGNFSLATLSPGHTLLAYNQCTWIK